MTDAKMALLELVEQEADTDLVREMLAFAAERMMEIEAKTGAPAGTRSADRLNHRNGYRKHAWDTRAGRAAHRPSQHPGLTILSLRRRQCCHIPPSND
jgi:transposase-like protein